METPKKCNLSIITKVLENFKKDPSVQNGKELMEMLENEKLNTMLRKLEGIKYYDNLLEEVNILLTVQNN